MAWKEGKTDFRNLCNSVCCLLTDISFLLLIHHQLKGGAATPVNLCQGGDHLSSNWMQVLWSSYSGLYGLEIYWNGVIMQLIHKSHWMRVRLYSYSGLYGIGIYWNNLIKNM